MSCRLRIDQRGVAQYRLRPGLELRVIPTHERVTAMGLQLVQVRPVGMAAQVKHALAAPSRAQ